MKARYRIERLSGQQRSEFACGVAALDRYLKRQASQDQRRRVAACYLLVESETERVVGCDTLSAGGVLLGDLPTATANKLPRYPTVPVVRLGRLAVDGGFHGQKLGSVLLFDAVKRAIASDLGFFAVVVDAEDEPAARFYGRYGFHRVESQPKLHYLPLSEAVRELG